MHETVYLLRQRRDADLNAAIIAKGIARTEEEAKQWCRECPENISARMFAPVRVINSDGGESPGSGAAGSYAAEKLGPGQRVWVDCKQYQGPGEVSTDTHYGSHLVHLGKDHAGEDRGLHVAVRLSNGNTHLYPSNAVKPAEREAA
jgi:hypothetical protein